MNINFQDPLFLIPAGVILLGLVLLVVAIGKLIKKTPPPPDFLASDAPFPETLPNENELIREPSGSDFLPVSAREVPPPPPPLSATGGNREMSERLDGMAQKLSDMQSVLQRQVAAAPSGAALTPETIDKLLKIIGNVTQQVDVLQKSLAVAPTLGAPALASNAAQIVASQTPPPAAVPTKPAVTPSPTPAPPAAGGKSIGVTGGALSSFGKSAPTGQKPGVTPLPPGSPPPSGKPSEK